MKAQVAKRPPSGNLLMDAVGTARYAVGMKKRLLSLLLVLVVLSAAGAAWYYLARGGSDMLANPRSLVPASTDIYAEVSSLGGLDAAVKEVGGLVGSPVNLAGLIGHYSGPIASALVNPAGAGIDESRPVGIAARIAGSSPLVVLMLPVKDKDALAAFLKVDASQLTKDPVVVEGGAVVIRQGYALAAEKPEYLKDLLSLESAPLTIPPPPPGAVLCVYISPATIATASRALSQERPGMSKPARLGASLLARFLQSLDGVQINLLAGGDAYRLKLLVGLKPGHGLREAWQDAAGAPGLLAYLPPGGLMAGARVNPVGLRRVAERVLNDIADEIQDTALLALFRESLDVMSDEVAVSFLKWNPTQPDDMRSVTLQTMAIGQEDSFAAAARSLRERGIQTMQDFMKSAGVESTTQTLTMLPDVTQRGITVSGMVMKTHMAMAVPIGADDATRATFERLSNQQLVQRFARVPNPAPQRVKSRELYVTAAGADTALLSTALDRLLDTSGATPPLPPAWTEAVRRLGDDVVAWVIMDPLILSGASAEPTQPMVLGVRMKPAGLELELIVRKDQLKAGVAR